MAGLRRLVRKEGSIRVRIQRSLQKRLSSNARHEDGLSSFLVARVGRTGAGNVMALLLEKYRSVCPLPSWNCVHATRSSNTVMGFTWTKPIP